MTVKIETGAKVLFTDAAGREHAAAVAYVWGPTGHPLVNLSYTKDGEPTVATSVPHKAAVSGASGYFYEVPEPKRIKVNIAADPGDLVEFTNLKNDHVQMFRVADPKGG